MSNSISVGYSLRFVGPDSDLRAPSDMTYLFGFLTMLHLLTDSRADARDLVSLDGNVLTFAPIEDFPPDLQAVFSTFFAAQMGSFMSAVTGGMLLTGGALDFRSDGSLRSIEGSVENFGITLNEGTDDQGSLSTQFFNSFALGTVLTTVANLLDPDNPLTIAAIANTMVSFLTINASVFYSASGGNGSEAFETGLGQNSISLGFGDDIARLSEEGYGAVDGGLGIDTLSARGWSAPIEYDINLGLASGLSDSQDGNEYDITNWEAYVGSGFGDRFRGSNGDETFYGNAGQDRAWGRAGDDTLFGGNGNDRQFGGGGDDSLTGGRGVDRQWGGNGSDTLFGGAGGDSLWGGKGHDFYFGGAGSDYFDLGPGNDVARGGAGDDDFAFNVGMRQGKDIVRGFADGDRLHFFGGLDDAAGLIVNYNEASGNTIIRYDNGNGGLNRLKVTNYEIDIGIDIGF